MDETWVFSALAMGVLALTVPPAKRRLELSRAKHRSLAGHARMAKRVAGLIPGYAYSEDEFFSSDGAPEAIVEKRKAGLNRIEAIFDTRYPKSIAMTEAAKLGLSDLQFTSAYRVPFQYSPYLRSRLKAASFVRASSGVMLQDIDGNQFHDLTGSYGVNLFGQDFYKACIEEAVKTAGELGPVLGSYHPCVLENVQRLQYTPCRSLAQTN